MYGGQDIKGDPAYTDTLGAGGLGGAFLLLAGKSDDQLRRSAGKTNWKVNAYGAGVAGAAAYDMCGCDQ